MQRQIPANILISVVGLLKPYRQNLSGETLMQALEACSIGVGPVPLPEAITKREYCNTFRRSLSSTNRDLKSGRLPSIKIGRSVRIPRSAVEALLDVPSMN